MSSVLEEQILARARNKQQAKADAVAAAKTDYVQIIHRRNEPRPGDDEALEKAMGIAGITAEQLAQDQDALDRLPALEARAKALTPERRAELYANADKADREGHAKIGEIMGQFFGGLPYMAAMLIATHVQKVVPDECDFATVFKSLAGAAGGIFQAAGVRDEAVRGANAAATKAADIRENFPHLFEDPAGQ